MGKEKIKKNQNTRIGIIGAGFTGLAACLYLTKRGNQVVLFEQEEKPGGLATGFTDNKWKWSLERHYHHLFVSDWSIRDLAKEVNHEILFERPTTSVFLKEGIYQLDSPNSLLKFPLLSIFDRFRIGMTLFFLKYNPSWKLLEKITAKKFLVATMGRRAWAVLWEPLFVGKFGKYTDKIAASWFWARIKKRSASLGYPMGGFEQLAVSVSSAIAQEGGDVVLGVGVSVIEKKGKEFLVKTDGGETYTFDKVICSLPTPLFLKITKGLPESYKKKLSGLEGIGAVNLVLALKESFLKDNTYWLNINERDFPFLAVVEHTNFMDSKYYGGDKLLYVGNYLPATHEYFKKSERELLREFYLFLKKINPDFEKSWVKKAWVFKAPFAQPVISLNYSKQIPDIRTPIEGLYLANIQQVYPWDRGTNYAVELGNKVAETAAK